MSNILVAFEDDLNSTDRAGVQTSIYEIRYHFMPPDTVGQFEELLVFVIASGQWFEIKTTSSSSTQVTAAMAQAWLSSHTPYWVEYLTKKQIV